MSWIVLGEKNGLVELRSLGDENTGNDGLIPVGSFLTVYTSEDSKVILQVISSAQTDPYSPTPLLAEMNLDGLIQDAKCYNIIKARRIYHKSNRQDGRYDFIKARSKAVRSSNEDIKDALHSAGRGPKVFPATIFSGENSLIVGNDKKYLHIKLDEEMFWHQMVICGSTGMGKTVAMKYLAHYFVEEMRGCVIALNVKDDDFLHMEKPSNNVNAQIIKEWESIGINQPIGIENFEIYHPFGNNYKIAAGVDSTRVHKITINASQIDPESLLGLLRDQMTDLASRWFPDIFRWWQKNNRGATFIDFIKWFDDDARGGVFNTLDINEIEGSRVLPAQTVGNISRALGYANKFFDVEGAEPIDPRIFLEMGKFCTIDLSGNDGIEFGSIFLRHILCEIKKIKSEYNFPVLIIVDEAHKFHSAGQGTKEALKYLDDICRTGRSNKIGIIFASQDLATIPKGLVNIVNTIISFSTPDNTTARKFSISSDDLVSLDKGYAVCMLHNIKNLKYIKFPLSISGVTI